MYAFELKQSQSLLFVSLLENRDGIPFFLRKLTRSVARQKNEESILVINFLIASHTIYKMYVEGERFKYRHKYVMILRYFLVGELLRVYMQCIPWNCPEGVAVQPVSGTF